MRFSAASVLVLAVGATSVSALQNIYIGTRSVCSKYTPDWYVWFIDGPACTTGTYVGPKNYFGNGLCGKDITILGHTGITFTGCSPPAPPYGLPGPPTGVSDGGNPALTCYPIDTVPDEICPTPCGPGWPDDDVKVLYQCS